MARRPNNRGGHRTPNKPAAVSGAGKDSKRTDGAFGKMPSNAEQARQPVRPIPAESHGDRQALSNLQGSAPMAAAPQTALGISQPTAGGTGGPTEAPPNLNLPFDPFAPDESPGGMDGGVDDDIIVDDTDMYMAQLAALVPGHPDLVNLITQRRLRGGF